ncbi:TIGR02285 family protein [Pseudomonas sp. 14P_8.1_Bac3]|uniref:TIGR02285 family protein n=1 Tax=Pseudomonas sp. 14P_8.1_Bac3 TaxID=2971621 RepID=UPI0021C8009E|nr:TIGR02285 family protein [Pseudomonas sp. 14P_8.1_Bac3]MCU1763306.1 TIGR02285 family protein [Pseudomonas sp. 14P_8.1_Bac3]
MTGNRSHSCVKTGPSKLKRLFAPLTPHARLNRATLACALAALLLCAAPAMAQPKDTMIWLLRDLPPLTIFEGPEKGQGVIDQLLPLLIDGMPQYRHALMRVNRARALQMLHEPSLTCDAALNKSKERERWIAFSIPVFRAMSNGLAVRRVDHEVIAPFLHDGEVDLAALLASGHEQLGIVAERNYGEYLDALLKQAPRDALTLHYGNDALGSLLQMQRLGRLRFLLGYRPEIRYQAEQQGIAEDELQFYPIRGAEKFLSGYIGCSDTPQGRQAIAEINALLRKLPRERLSEAYAAWLDPESRDAYLKESRTYFEQQVQP